MGEDQAVRWHRRIVEIWTEEVRRRQHATGTNANVYLARAMRCRAAAQRSLDDALAGMWPDDDRAMRPDGRTRTTPG